MHITGIRFDYVIPLQIYNSSHCYLVDLQPAKSKNCKITDTDPDTATPSQCDCFVHGHQNVVFWNDKNHDWQYIDICCNENQHQLLVNVNSYSLIIKSNSSDQIRYWFIKSYVLNCKLSVYSKLSVILTRVPTPPGKSWIFFLKIPGPGKALWF